MNIFKKVPLEKWTAYIAPLPKNSLKEHRIIIICHTEEEIKYFFITSQEQKVRLRLRKDFKALVEIKKEEWNNLTKETSFIQCDKVHLEKISFQDFQKMYEDEILKYLGKIPKSIQEKIKNAVLNSVSYDLMEKETLTE